MNNGELNPADSQVTNNADLLSEMPSFEEHMKSYHRAKLDGELPDGVRDEQDYKEYLEEQMARKEENEVAVMAPDALPNRITTDDSEHTTAIDDMSIAGNAEQLPNDETETIREIEKIKDSFDQDLAVSVLPLINKSLNLGSTKELDNHQKEELLKEVVSETVKNVQDDRRQSLFDFFTSKFLDNTEGIKSKIAQVYSDLRSLVLDNGIDFGNNTERERDNRDSFEINFGGTVFKFGELTDNSDNDEDQQTKLIARVWARELEEEGMNRFSTQQDIDRRKTYFMMLSSLSADTFSAEKLENFLDDRLNDLNRAIVSSTDSQGNIQLSPFAAFRLMRNVWFLEFGREFAKRREYCERYKHCLNEGRQILEQKEK